MTDDSHDPDEILSRALRDAADSSHPADGLEAIRARLRRPHSLVLAWAAVGWEAAIWRLLTALDLVRNSINPPLAPLRQRLALFGERLCTSRPGTHARPQPGSSSWRERPAPL